MWFVGIVCFILFSGIIIIFTYHWQYVIIFFKACMFIVGPILIGGCLIGYKLFPEEPKDK